MLIRICDIRFRHIEIPIKCSGCGDPIEAVNEVSLGDGSTTLIASDELDLEPENTWDSKSDLRASCQYTKTFMVVAYRHRCHDVLIEGEFTDEEAG